MNRWQVGAAATIAGGLALAGAGLAAERWLEARDARERAMELMLDCLEPWHEAGPGSLPGYREARRSHFQRCEASIPLACRRAEELGQPVEACGWVLGESR